MSAKSVRIGVLVIRPDKIHEITPDFVGLSCSGFIVGYGLDYNQQGRQYPEIYQKYDEWNVYKSIDLLYIYLKC